MIGEWEYMNKKVLVLTGGTDEFKSKDCTDLFIKDVLTYTNPSKERYAKKHGYDFINLDSLGTDPLEKFSSREIGIQRLLRVFDYLKLYDVVMWLDADALVTNDNFDVNTIGLDEQHIFYGSNVWNGHTLNGLPYFSSGNFMVHKTPAIEEFINYFYHVALSMDKNSREEQHALNLIHKFSPIRDKFKIVDNNIFESIPSREMYDPYWKPSLPIIHQWKDENFLVHLTAASNFGRVDIMKKYFAKYI